MPTRTAVSHWFLRSARSNERSRAQPSHLSEVAGRRVGRVIRAEPLEVELVRDADRTRKLLERYFRVHSTDSCRPGNDTFFLCCCCWVVRSHVVVTTSLATELQLLRKISVGCIIMSFERNTSTTKKAVGVGSLKGKLHTIILF